MIRIILLVALIVYCSTNLCMGEIVNEISKKDAIKIAAGYLDKQNIKGNVIFFLPRVKQSDKNKDYWKVIYYPSPRIILKGGFFTYSILFRFSG